MLKCYCFLEWSCHQFYLVTIQLYVSEWEHVFQKDAFYLRYMQIAFGISCFLTFIICTFVFFQVYLKYPEVSLTLPISIGSIAVDPTLPRPSRSVPPKPIPRTNTAPALAPSPTPATTDSTPPSLPPRTNPKPKPRPRSAYVPPSAPPAELYPQLPGAADYNMEIPRSPQVESGQTAVSPNAFSYAPGLSFRLSQNANNASAAPPQNRERSQTLSASSTTIQPPDYRSSPYPHGI